MKYKFLFVLLTISLCVSCGVFDSGNDSSDEEGLDTLSSVDPIVMTSKPIVASLDNTIVYDAPRIAFNEEGDGLVVWKSKNHFGQNKLFFTGDTVMLYYENHMI